MEILLNPQFAETHGLTSGSAVSMAAGGRRKTLTVTGTAAGPEFVYAVKDTASLLEDPSSFGVAILPQNQLQQLLEMKGSVNQLLVRFTPGTDRTEAVREIENILEPYGNLANYGRKDQLSEADPQGRARPAQGLRPLPPLRFSGDRRPDGTLRRVRPRGGHAGCRHPCRHRGRLDLSWRMSLRSMGQNRFRGGRHGPGADLRRRHARRLPLLQRFDGRSHEKTLRKGVAFRFPRPHPGPGPRGRSSRFR